MGRTIVRNLQRATEPLVTDGDPASVDSFFTVREYQATSRKTVFLFGGWGSGVWMYTLFRRFLTSLGYGVVMYIPHAALIKERIPFSTSVRAAQAVVADVDDRIRESFSQDQTSTFACVGISYGSLFAMEVVRAFSVIKKIVLVTPFGDFTEHAELWQQDQFWRRVWLSQPTTIYESANVLNSIGTAKQLDKLRGRDILIFRSLDDQIMHGHVIHSLVKRMQRRGINVKDVVLGGRHGRAIIASLHLHRRVIADFLVY